MKQVYIFLFFLLLFFNSVAQTNPPVYELCKGSYTFTEWSATEAAETYPANMVFHRAGTQDPALTASSSADYTGAYNLTTGTRINGLGVNGIYFQNLATAGNLGMAVLALNASGRKDINIGFLAGLELQSTGTWVYALRLQYRVGISSSWSDVPGPVEFSSSGKVNGDTETFSGIILPSSCNNESIVQVRWFYYAVSGSSGTRPRLRLDDIDVSSSPVYSPESDLIQATSSESAYISSLTTGTINDVTDGVQVWQFTIRDGGASASDADNLPTIVKSIKIIKGFSSTAGNFDAVINDAALFDGTNKITSGVITASDITFSSVNFTVPDNSGKDLSLRITLKNSGLIDNSKIQFSLNSSGIETENTCISSQMESFGDIASDALLNKIEVEATELIFISPPDTVSVNVDFPLTLAAVDIHGNIDYAPRVAYVSLGVPGTGDLSSIAGLGPVSMNNGLYTWTDLQYNKAEEFQVIANDNSGFAPLSVSVLINAVSGCLKPLDAAGDLSFSAITSSSVNLFWTPGSGTSRLVLAREGLPVSDFPVDGIFYSANATFGTSGTELGDAFVIYNGGGNSIAITGLAPSTKYHFAIIEYGCSPEKYLSDNPETGFVVTDTVVLVNDLAAADQLKIYPNPVINSQIFFNKTIDFELFDITGKLLMSHKKASSCSVEGFRSGIYFLKPSGGSVYKVVIN
jgi:hypothetical protein